MNQCINVEDLSKKYGHKEIVKSLSFQVEQGQIFAFLGPNGAGKSTTMNMLGTLLQKSSGSISVDGSDMDKDYDSIKKKIGMVFQEDVLDGELSVYHNLMYRGGLYWKNDKELRMRIDEVVNLLALGEIKGQKYSSCSGGQRRLVQIARALLPNPRLLILDEPTTGLDPVTRQRVWETLISLKETQHITIFYTTHYLDEAAFADTICILKSGRILVCGALKQIQASYSVKGRLPSLDEIYMKLLTGDEK